MSNATDLELYYKSEYIRALSLFNERRRIAFKSRELLATWFVETLVRQNCSCYYCEISIFEIKSLISRGILKTRKVRGEGMRGPVLEIDKEGDTYDMSTCVLCCYYCNNDKSYITQKDDYKMNFGKNRGNYFKTLIAKLA